MCYTTTTPYLVDNSVLLDRKCKGDRGLIVEVDATGDVKNLW